MDIILGIYNMEKITAFVMENWNNLHHTGKKRVDYVTPDRPDFYFHTSLTKL